MFEILINKRKDDKEIILLENGKTVEYYIDKAKSNRKEGNIYIGIVKDIIKGMQAAFVDIATEKNSFIHIKDVLPKVDETKQEIKNEVDIKDIMKNEQKILVQVKKDSNKQKGARVSTHINLPGKYIALMPNTDIITISQKIENKEEQDRLIKIVKENITKGNGAVIRTSAMGKESEIIEEIRYLENKWAKVQAEFNKDTENKPRLLLKAENIVEKMIIDLPQNEIQKIIINNKKDYEKLLKLKNESNYYTNIEICLKENENLAEMYNIEKEIQKIDNRKIWLKCGGFITIDQTEALTAIDVNTGKYTGSKNVEQTIYKVNEEATIEIAKQLRLRDIGGIIIIDYIDMNNIEDKKKIQEILEENLKRDRTKTQVEGFTKLDLMEMTRKHICSHMPSNGI